MKFTNLKISHECIFPIDNVAQLRSRKTFYNISVNFRNPGFRSVSKPRKKFLFLEPVRPLMSDTNTVPIKYNSGILPVNASLPALYFFVRGKGQMLLFVYKMGVHWCFQFGEKTANNKDKMSKYKALKPM